MSGLTGAIDIERSDDRHRYAEGSRVVRRYLLGQDLTVTVWIECFYRMTLRYRNGGRVLIHVGTNERKRCLLTTAELENVDRALNINAVKLCGINPTVGNETLAG